MAAALEQTVEVDSITDSLRKQLRYDNNGATLTNVERFQLEQKYGLVEPVLTDEEKQLIAAEEVALDR